MTTPERPLDLAKLSPADRKKLFRALPKTDLHCHLDGSLRVSTVAELAQDPKLRERAHALGYTLPEDASEKTLERVLRPGVDCKSLVEYLLPFDIICGVLQTPGTLERAAYELAVDAAAENVWYLEVRFAPQRHINDDLDGLGVLQAVDRGLARAEKEHGGRLRTGIIVCAMRHYDERIGYYHRRVRESYRYSSARELASHCSLEVARLAAEARKRGLLRVVAFDLAGPEETGEGYGPASIKQAVTHLNAHRIGHGTRVLEDKKPDLLEFLRDHRVAIEVCLTSNVQTKAVRSLAEHPFRRLLDEEVRAPLCTDNRLVSGITLSDEYALAYEQFKLTPKELRRVVLYGFKAAFVSYQERRRLLLAAKAKLRELGLGGTWSRDEEDALASLTGGR
ncbi:adenosine deaminase family protein [bacterium]|nr:adenosine deaminase family protein [bacterium]